MGRFLVFRADWDTMASMKLPEGTLSGRCSPIGDVADGNCLVVQELGSDPDLRSNRDIVDYVYTEGNERLASLPKFVSGSIAQILRGRGHGNEIVLAFEGPSATNRGENLGTYGELRQYADYSTKHGRYNRPIFVTSGYNMGNIWRQARLLGIGGIIPPNLPRSFDIHSDQLWTKHWALWALTSKLRLHLLEAEGH
jgi:hypothetical protein